ncbi:MAG TPA: DUF4382 domain-containing protein [bacterium]|nr:DUF4382 domain-containing protein [bacterium]
MINNRWQWSVVVLLIAAFAAAGCGDDDNGVGNNGAQGKMVLLMHDAPVDDFKEVWLTVESVTMIGADADSAAGGEVVLDNAVRMDFLALDSVAQVLAAAEVAAGSYSKIRFQVSDPEFVRDDDSVFAGEDIHLVANGHVDINTQGNLIVVGNEVTVISLDLDLDNSIQINQTGNGRYILRPQIFVDGDTDGDAQIIIDGAVISSVDLGTGIVTVTTSGAESDTTITVLTDSETEILAVGGLAIPLASLLTGSTVDIVGTIDLETGVVTATSIQVTL